MPAKPILIAGPTASGKSALALALAERLGGTIINADSMQVYSELCILTARPSAEDTAWVPHRLYGHVAASEAYSAGRFMAEAAREIATAQEAQRVPIIIGGTGLYFKALLEGLSPIPPIPAAIREKWRNAAETAPPSELHRQLSAADAQTASRLKPGDLQRIVRALEVHEATGRSLADWQREPGTPVLKEADTTRLAVMPERSELYRRCDNRFNVMLAAGAVDEAARFARLGLDPALPACRALGLRPLIAHVRGELTLDAAASAAKNETRQYAKRQTTWLRRHMIAWTSIDAQLLECDSAHFLSFMKDLR